MEQQYQTKCSFLLCKKHFMLLVKNVCSSRIDNFICSFLNIDSFFFLCSFRVLLHYWRTCWDCSWWCLCYQALLKYPMKWDLKASCKWTPVVFGLLGCSFVSEGVVLFACLFVCLFNCILSCHLPPQYISCYCDQIGKSPPSLLEGPSAVCLVVSPAHCWCSAMFSSSMCCVTAAQIVSCSLPFIEPRNHRNVERLGLERTLKIISFQPPCRE